MRAGIGLLGLLIGVAVIFWISFGPMGGNAKHGYEGAVLDEGKKAREQAQQISGHDENGVPVSESIKLDEINDDSGHLRRLKVVSVVADGPFATAYGLQANDEITEADGLNVRDNGDAALAKSLVLTGYQENKPLTVVRGGQTLTLTPKTALSDFHPEMFAKPGATAVPSH